MDEHNAEAIDALRRRQFRLAVLFYGFLAAIPLGVVCPCGLAAVVYRLAPDWSQPVALSSFLLPLLGLAGALLLLGDRSRVKRSLALAKLADAVGLRYTGRADADRVAAVAAFPYLNLLRTPRSENGANLLEGTYRRRNLTAVDYTFLGLLAYKHFVSRQTVAAFTGGFRALPDFAAAPRAWGDWVDRFLLGEGAGRQIKTIRDREFNRRFAVVGEDERTVAECLGPGVRDLLLEDGGLGLEVHDGSLLVYRRGALIGADAYEDFLALADGLARELQRPAGKD